MISSCASAVLTEMAKPLLARLPAVIDAAPVRADVGAPTNAEGKYRLLARLPAVIDAAPVRADVGAPTNAEGKYR
jgi:hypothetical protein